jgi:hypothetical protein
MNAHDSMELNILGRSHLGTYFTNFFRMSSLLEIGKRLIRLLVDLFEIFFLLELWIPLTPLLKMFPSFWLLIDTSKEIRLPHLTNQLLNKLLLQDPQLEKVFVLLYTAIHFPIVLKTRCVCVLSSISDL